ncbi:hypothetical protein ACIBL3_43620 [Kribbella sp. NPDC050124]|uniref:hypothetical protein n=1 Tax=Kribbella sp. NPDC050124 TaxID=3364114 RepID=UPI0037ABBA41
MRTYLLTTPRWVVGLFSGLVFGLGMAALIRFSSPPASWREAAVIGGVAGVLFGSAMAFGLDRQRRELRAAAGDLPPRQLLEAYRAAFRGPMPDDPLVRSAAARVARRRLESLRRARILFVILAILMGIGAVTNLIGGDYWGAALLAAAALAWFAELVLQP